MCSTITAKLANATGGTQSTEIYDPRGQNLCLMGMRTARNRSTAIIKNKVDWKSTANM